MNANYDRKRALRSWHNLPKYEQESIKSMLTEEFYKALNHEEAKLQKIWLKYGCIANNIAHGHGERRCSSWLGTWRRIYKTNSKFKTEEEQTAWIDERINKIFKHGYPSEFIDKFEEEK